MNASVLQENFSKAISGVSRIISTRPTLPVLSHLLLKAEKGKMSVIGTDLTTSLVLEMGGKIEKEGSVTVPAGACRPQLTEQHARRASSSMVDQGGRVIRPPPSR